MSTRLFPLSARYRNWLESSPSPYEKVSGRICGRVKLGPKTSDGTDSSVNGGEYSTSVELPAANAFPRLMNMLPKEVRAIPKARAGNTTSGLLSVAGEL